MVPRETKRDYKALMANVRSGIAYVSVTQISVCF